MLLVDIVLEPAVINDILKESQAIIILIIWKLYILVSNMKTSVAYIHYH